MCENRGDRKMDVRQRGRLNFRRVSKERDLLRFGFYITLIADDVMLGYRNFRTRRRGGLQYFTIRGGMIFLSVED